MKQLLSWCGAGLITTALLDPLIHASLQQPVRWLRDLLMLAGGIACLYLLFTYRRQW